MLPRGPWSILSPLGHTLSPLIQSATPLALEGTLKTHKEIPRTRQIVTKSVKSHFSRKPKVTYQVTTLIGFKLSFIISLTSRKIDLSKNFIFQTADSLCCSMRKKLETSLEGSWALALPCPRSSARGYTHGIFTWERPSRITALFLPCSKVLRPPSRPPFSVSAKTFPSG